MKTFRLKCRQCDSPITINLPDMGDPPSEELLADREMYEALRAMGWFWSTTPPVKEGWYWAVLDGDTLSQAVYLDRSMKIPWPDGGALDRKDFILWIGPLPVPAPPKDAK